MKIQSKVAARRREREKGVSLVILSVSMVFLTSMMGLAVDVGSLFVIKAAMGAAADSAALAAGRSLNLGDTIAAVETSARTSAQQYFRANFPIGFMGSDPSDGGREVTTDFQMQEVNGVPNGVLVVTVNARVKAPTYFMKVFDVPYVNVVSRGVATRRSLVLEMVLDRSGSMGTRNPTSPGTIPTSLGNTACEAMVYSAIEFVKMFSPYDYLGLVTFNAQGKIEYANSNQFKNSGSSGVTQKIANINCGGNTNTTAALELAYQDIQARNLRLATNAIVIFTDGMPNGVNASAFPIRQSVDTRLGKARDVNSTNPPNTPSGNRANCLSTDKICVNMPVLCPTTGTHTGPRGMIAQQDGFDPNGGDRSEIQKTFSSDASPVFPAGCVTNSQDPKAVSSQTVAYIPQLDRWGNRTWGNPIPFRDNWVYGINARPIPAGTPVSPWINPSDKFEVGGLWSSAPSNVGPLDQNGNRIRTNFFTAGPYAGQLRSDTPNAIGIASMNSAFEAAAKIRADATYNIIISAIYLVGNGNDPVDRYFLPIMTNQPMIPPIIVDPNLPPATNPYYQSGQQVGTYIQLINAFQLNQAFMQIASSLLRISQ